MDARRAYQLVKNLYHFLQAHLWRAWYGFPDKGLHLYGVTGTNGKTTTCHLVAGMLSARYGADKVGMLTTINVRIGTKENVNETKLTTLPSKLVYSYLSQMKKLSVTHVVLEMTSHALDQHRLAGLTLEGAIITNIEREHLNYHRTMKEYTAAKLGIVRYLKSSAPFVYKKEDEWIEKGLRNVSKEELSRIKLVPFTPAEAVQVQTRLLGEVNKENALAVHKLGEALGISQDTVKSGILSVAGVPGRMEDVENTKGFRIIIDYAVTPAALERLYKDVKASTRGRVLALLGAAGLRDRGKRPDMARVVASYADVLVITREDPWTEDEEQIFTDLEQGLSKEDKRWKRIVDRREALEYLLGQAKPGDAVVVTGKGAETGMGVGKKIIPWSDRQVIQDIVSKLP